MRSLSREVVFKYIFSKLFNQNDEGLFDVLCKELNSDDKAFAKDLLNAVESNQEKYLNNKKIRDFLTGEKKMWVLLRGLEVSSGFSWGFHLLCSNFNCIYL